MREIIAISWRNVWRNPLRSGVVITSIALGIWAGLFSISFSYGLNEQRTRNAIENVVSNLQIHHPSFPIDRDMRYTITGTDSLMSYLDTAKNVRSFTARALLNGMASSSRGGNGVIITGINPEKERRVTKLHNQLKQGSYLGESFKNQVVIGQKLADKMGVRLRSKIVLTFQSSDGTIIAGAFRVAGIYASASSKFDELNVFVNQDDLFNLLDSEPLYHEIAALVHNDDQTEALVAELNLAFPLNKTESWRDISPELGYADEVMVLFLYLFLTVIMSALAFGIVNTMMMAVLERRRELGMLMAIGMNKGHLFSMIMIETIFLAAVGGPIGIGLAYGSISYFHERGIDLSLWAEGLSNYGIDPVVYNVIPSSFYLNIGLMVIATAFLSALYPARKALKLNPNEAIRSI